MKENQKTSTEIMDIVVDVSAKLGQVGIVCLMLSVLVSLGY
ncbi:hypothetical protein ACFO4O_00900 [Glaciecola siphonariae]|uniref:Uncharacterized protein n=1 Tax=Glaciecola siphonariae TaxID=521012 RepID=A0ABV9LQI0_9ALTE